MMLVLSLALLSPAFGYGDRIPVLYTADGEDISPPLVWKGDFEASSFALVCRDPDAPSGDWVHWVVYNIPGNIRELPEGIPALPALEDGTLQGMNSWGMTGYGGPAPPSGKHRYVFTLYALDGMLHLEAGATADQLMEAMEGNVVHTAELIGEYGRD